MKKSAENLHKVRHFKFRGLVPQIYAAEAFYNHFIPGGITNDPGSTFLRIDKNASYM